MASENLPDKYLLFNDYQSKNLVVVVEIEGVDTLISNTQFYTVYRYGDVGLLYGTPGVVYGGLRPVSNQRNILSLDGSLTISQKIEPEQGRGAISTLSMTFVDKDQFVTQLVSPGIIVDEILGKRVKVWLGFQQISYPEDYFVIFRGVITSVEDQMGKYNIQFSDANIKKKLDLFYTATSTLSAGITNSATTIPVTSNADFHKKIMGPDGTYDPAIKVYLTIDDEVIEYQQTGFESTGFGVNQFLNVVRGARGTTASAHDPDADVSCSVELQDHGIDMALKLQMSGWAGPWKTDVPLLNIVRSGDAIIGDVDGLLVLPDQVDAVDDYGLAVGDWITITGDTFPANNITVQITEIADLFSQPNRLLYTTGTGMVVSENTPALMAFRSQFDTYPATCGAKLTGEDVDVAGFVAVKDLFLSQSENSYRFYRTDNTQCKAFLDSQIFLPMAAYSLTRRGRLSIGYSKPPIADQVLIILDKTNILDPQNIRPKRAVNDRKFFNQIDYAIDYTDSGVATQNTRTFDSQSLSQIGIIQILPIKAEGARSDLNFGVVLDRRVRFLLQRYRKSALMIKMKVNWRAGSQIEAGDVVAVRDDGFLHIPNFATGERNIGTQLFEVTGRDFDIKSGNVSLELLGGIGASFADRFATISPSSFLDVGSTTTKLILKDSFGAIFPGNERKKYQDYIGLPIIIHDYTYSFEETRTLVSFNGADARAIDIDPPLSIAPPANYIVDIDRYPTDADPETAKIYKVVHAFLSPTVSVTSGTDATHFDVGVLDIGKFFVGAVIQVHNYTYTIASEEVTVLSIAGTTIETNTSLGFTPAAGQFVDFIGFADHGSAYRFI